jgi:dihydropteroate synthase
VTLPEPAGRLWALATRVLSLDRPLIMGVVNVTPDSFSDGGRYLTSRQAVDHGLHLIADGADLIDVGGESTRPGAKPVNTLEEIARVVPVIEQLARHGVPISIDTSKSEVAAAGLEAGADLVNDVTACGDPSMAPLVASAGAGLVLMHMKGTPRTMQEDPRYDDVVLEVSGFLGARAAVVEAAGVRPESICIDPGIGFGKSQEHNLILLNRLAEFTQLGYPLLIGTSRKAFLGTLTGHQLPDDRDLATAVSSVLAFERGADVIRVHNVSACREALQVALAIVRPSGA